MRRVGGCDSPELQNDIFVRIGISAESAVELKSGAMRRRLCGNRIPSPAVLAIPQLLRFCAEPRLSPKRLGPNLVIEQEFLGIDQRPNDVFVCRTRGFVTVFHFSLQVFHQ